MPHVDDPPPHLPSELVPDASPPGEATVGALVPPGTRTEEIDLATLVHHRESVPAEMHLEEVQRRFRASTVEYFAVERAGRVIGLCARGQVGFVMGSRFGFAIYSKDSVDSVLAPSPLIVTKGDPIRQVLERALVRRGEEFIEDIVLVDHDSRLLGLVKVEVLAQLQSRLVAEQLRELRDQHETLRKQNLELFRANHAARQSHGLYLGLFASHTLGVALLDERAGIFEYNERFAELLNLTDVPGPLVPLAEWVVEGERAAFLAFLESHARAQKGGATQEFTFAIPGRGPRIVRCSVGWIRETGQICGCFDDLTEQRTLERSLLVTEKQRLLDTLVGGIAHELNNKLAPIMGFSELLRADDRAQASEYINLIVKSVEEAAKIIRQLLELSKPASQAVRPVDLRLVAEETIALLNFQMRQCGCSVRALLAPAPVSVMGDAGQLKQVALNLMLNALHALEGCARPTIVVEVRAVGPVAELSVSDNGCGIESANLNRIFDPFFTTKGPERGTGLGLSVCFSIVRQYGGEIKVESRVGAGSRFAVALRLEPSVALLTNLDSPSSAFLLRPRRPGLRVLIVEDEIVLRRLLQEIISGRFGCRIETATNGAEALALLERGEFDLILADIRMPVMSGTELYRHLRESRPDLARRFVFVTGNYGEKQLEAEIAGWGVPLIAKPFTIARLAEACAPFFQQAQGSQVG